MAIKKAWSYFQVAPIPTNLAVTLADMKAWLKITDSAQDDLITSLIKGATLTAAKMTKREMITKTFETFRDNFSDYDLCYGAYAPLTRNYFSSWTSGIELRKSRLQSVVSVEYLKDSVLTLVDSAIYYATQETDFSSISLVDGESWPSDLDSREQAVKIKFTAGYGDDSGAIPEDLKTAIKMHVADAFANRGDCVDGKFLPPGVARIYNQNRIMDIAL